MKMQIKFLAALVLALVMILTFVLPVAAVHTGPATEVYYSGQGLTAGGTDFEDEVCGVANGAEVDGPYIYWVLTATKSSSATITGPWGTADMTKKGNGSFYYISDFYTLSSLIGTVYADWDTLQSNVQLVISHGCCGTDICCP